jgi:large conductance mechanosensitive channel
MKKFFAEFKKFITRGNVVDMAVGVIVGSSFTAIVNGMSNYILKPLINSLLAIIFGKDTLTELFTMLKPAYVLDEAGVATAEIDLANSIYIDWGSFINAVINFFLIAFVLFVIVKIINKFREDHNELRKSIEKATLSRSERKELKAAGVNIRDRKAVKAYYENKQKLAEEEAAKKAAADAEAARIERENNPTTEDLLKMILAEMKK